MKRWDVRLSGFGGQGVISAGHIIARSVLYLKNKDAVVTKSYGPEKTGGWAVADVVVTYGEVDYPLVDSPNIFIALSQDGFDRNAASIRPGALVMIDDMVETNGELEDVIVVPIPATKEAEALGRRVVANIVMLGAFAMLTDVVTPRALKRAILDTVPKGTEELNTKAFLRGLELAEEVVEA